MSKCKAADVNIYEWPAYFLDHIHEYDYNYTHDFADFLPGILMKNGLVKAAKESPATT